MQGERGVTVIVVAVDATSPAPPTTDSFCRPRTRHIVSSRDARRRWALSCGPGDSEHGCSCQPSEQRGVDGPGSSRHRLQRIERRARAVARASAALTGEPP